MGQIKTGKVISDGGAVNIPIDFIPDYLKVIARGASSTNAIVYETFPRLMAELGTIINGWSFTDGVDAEVADGSGPDTYDSAAEGPSVSEWSSAVSTAATARTSTAHGTYVRPTRTGGKGDINAIFECVTAGTSSGTEPTWPKEDGGQVTDGTTVFEKVVIPSTRVGYQGFSLPASLTGFADGNEAYFVAIKSDSSEDLGDVTGWTDGVRGA